MVPGGNSPAPVMSRVAQLIAAVLSLEPSGPAVEFEEVWTSWGELASTMHKLSRQLDEFGFSASTRVGVVLRDRPEMIATIAQLICSQRCLVALNSSYPDERLAADVIDTAVPVVVLVATDWERTQLRDAVATSGALAIALGENGEARIMRPPDEGKRSQWSASAPGIALEMLTSGTTGKPKRIAIARASFEKSMLDALQFESGGAGTVEPKLRSGVQILTSPFAHIAGIQAVMNVLLSGRKSSLLGKFTIEAFRRAIVRHRPKVVAATPAAVRMIVDAAVPREDLSSLVAFRTGAAALDPQLVDTFYERYGVPILQNYGATEFGGVAGWTPDDFRRLFHEKRGSVGRINRGIDARVVDAQSGLPLAPGATGLLELRAPHIGDGQGWLRTSDLAALDGDKFLWIKGRADGAIVRGGFKIQPEDVVDALQSHPAIAEAAVVGIPDARLGAVPVAAYTLSGTAASPSQDDLQKYLRGRLLAYQVPVRFLQVEELPRTESMKVSLVGVKKLFGA
jgi:long-chain acyl-CoA synthetase